MRDSLSLTDQGIAQGKGTINLENNDNLRYKKIYLIVKIKYTISLS